MPRTASPSLPIVAIAAIIPATLGFASMKKKYNHPRDFENKIYDGLQGSGRRCDAKRSYGKI